MSQSLLGREERKKEKEMEQEQEDLEEPHSQRSTLCFSSDAAVSWTERGRGHAKLLQSRLTCKEILRLRQENTMKIVCDFFSVDVVPYDIDVFAGSQWISRSRLKYEQRALIFASRELNREFKDAVDEAKQLSRGPG